MNWSLLYILDTTDVHSSREGLNKVKKEHSRTIIFTSAHEEVLQGLQQMQS